MRLRGCLIICLYWEFREEGGREEEREREGKGERGEDRRLERWEDIRYKI